MRNTFKWIGIVVATLLVIVVVFHRPIVFRLTRYFIVRAAEQQNLKVDYKIAGSIFTTCGSLISKRHLRSPGLRSGWRSESFGWSIRSGGCCGKGCPAS